MQQGYLNYLKESLGIEDFILPARDEAKRPDRSVPLVSAEATPLAFYVQSADKSLSAAATELLRKMTQAMGRNLEATPLTMLAAGNPFVEGPCAIKVLFTSDLQSTSVGNWQEGVMTTYSPELLLQKPELKKSTWAHLQLVMAELQR